MINLFTVVFILFFSYFSFGAAVKLANSTKLLVIQPVTSVHAAPTLPISLKAPPVLIKSFNEWKNEKVQVAIKRVTITRAQIEYKKLNKQFLRPPEPLGTKDLEIERLEGMLKNDLYSLEVARELNVTHYFAIYLTKQQDKAGAYKEAAKKMTEDEVNQLIKAYADSMFPSTPGTKVDPIVGPTAMEKTDNTK